MGRPPNYNLAKLLYARNVKGEYFNIFEYNQRLYSQGGLARNDRGFEHSICACLGHAASERH